jgi:ABC-type multidrug transport system fused ATPase/permease subunit
MSDTKTEVKPLSRSEREAKIKDKAGFIIVFLAALLAINTMIGGSNSSKIQNNTIQANNMWAWYQAKNVRGVLYEINAAETTNKDNKERFLAEKERMDKDKKEIMEKAKVLEAERDAAKLKSPWFTWSGSVLQIAIVLLTASILAVSMPMFYISTVVGAVGAVLVSQALWMWIPWLG